MVEMRAWKTLIAIILIFGISTTNSSSKDPFSNQPRIVVENGHMILRSAENRNVTISSTGQGSVWVNKIDISTLVNSMKSYLSGSSPDSMNINTISHNVQELQSQWNSVSSIITQVNQLEENVTAISAKFDLFVGRGQNIISNRGLRRVIRKVDQLADQVKQLTELLSTDECSSHPCRNGGTCVDTYNGFLCRCPTNWEGTVCDTDVNECALYAGTDLGCQNGATCYNSQGSYRCECLPNWYGIHCTERHDDCTSASHQELCGHGTCVNEARIQPGQSKYRCICEPGWQQGRNGPACTEDVDECAGSQSRCSQNPPVLCINLPGTFHCGPCPQGYTGNGQTCSDINECEVNNGGCSVNPHVSCSNTLGSRVCGPCPQGYVGNGIYCTFMGICSINRGGCHPLATCLENSAISGSYRECRCPPGYAGNGEGLTGCMASAGTSCANNPCQHGSCQVTGNSFHCICVPGYTGTLCDQAVSPCFSNPCQNGGTCVSQFNSFTCTCTEAFEGPTCAQIKQSCGGFLNGNNGTLQYPRNHGEEYQHQQNCAWKITVEDGKVLNLTFDRFHLEEGPNCEFDFVQIHDGPSALSHPIGRFCGDSTILGRTFQSTHNEVYIWFHSDSSVAGMGFTFTWNASTPLCGANLQSASYGAINSPGYPGPYPRNRDCYWDVQVARGKKIQFHFATLQLESHENCSFDYLKIVDGFRSNDPVLATYCTTVTPPPLLTSGSSARLHFHTDQSVEDTGFHITYAAVPGVPGCGGTLTSPSGVFASPNFPDVADHLLTCDWLIRIHPGDRLRLTFKVFSLEYHRNCRFDYVEIYDGSSDAAPIIGRYCGSEEAPDVMSNGNQLFVKFHTDSVVQSNGFRAEYNTICGGFYSELEGSISSPYFPESYPSSVTCHYQIRVPLGSIIQLQFTTFAIEWNARCVFDYLQVRDGASETSNLIGQYCGYSLPDPILSSYNELWLKFNSDGSVQNYGFYANYTSLELGCGGVMSNNRGSIQSPRHPNFYPPSVTCRWLIRAPPGHIIRLTFESFSMERHAQCDYDFLLVEDSSLKKIGKFCGLQLPPTLTSTDNEMFITFTADSSVSHEGFNASYVFLDSSQMCGGDFYIESGVVRSPRFPRNYPHNRNCVWVLHAENGHQILLNVTSFAMEQHKDCKYDYLELRNGGFQTSPLIGRYCGETIPTLVTSHSNDIRLEFRSDGSQSGPGFEIEYDSTTTGCGGTLKSPRGSITSPNYPEPYGHNAECTWIIRVSEGSAIAVAFVDTDIEEHLSCKYDYVQVFDGNSENSRSLIRLCNNQQNPGPIISSGNTLFVKFRTDISGSGRGFHLSYYTLCNNVLNKRRGVIESPNFPNTYPHNHNCTWTITAPLGSNVSLAFSHMFLEGGASCTADYIEVLELHDEGLTQLAKYCGTPSPLPPVIETTSNTAMVRLVTDATVSSEGFRLEWTVKGCGGDIQRSYGYITSPNFPYGYPHRTECIWHIKYAPGSRVELKITDFDLEGADECMFDYLKVYGGEDEESPRLLNLCHLISTPQVITSHGNQMMIHFASDHSVSRRGFKAIYKELQSGCGGKFTTTESTIMSPNYPSHYNANDECNWLIQVDSTHLVTLEFYDFSLPTSTNCTKSHVAIYDGLDSNMSLLAKFCGEIPPDTVISATNNQMLVRLVADGTNVAKGFKAHYKSGCGRRLLADEGGEISSPNYPHNSIFINHCSWIIYAQDPGEHVTLTFTHLIVSDENCTHSVLEVREGDEPNSPLVGQYCGRRTPPAIVSQGNSLHVTLNMHGLFRATYGITSSYCGGTYMSESGSFSSPGYPNNYPIDTECIWIIQASAGNKVQVSFQIFNLEESDYCNVDYVEIHENDAGGPLVGRYCGNRIPSNVTAVHKMWIKFRSDQQGSTSGFMAHYGLIHGAQLNGTEGIIESPGYPLSSYHDHEYEWTVTVPQHLFVSIQFLVINISPPPEQYPCFSAVRIYDGFDAESPPLGEFCGFALPEPVISHGNQVTIIFGGHRYIGGYWRLQWVAVNETAIVVTEPSHDETASTCWHEINLNSSMSMDIKSPGYPDSYEPNLNCTWIIRTPSFDHIKLSVIDMQLQGGRDYCLFDALEVYTAPISYVDAWELNTTLCGRDTESVLESPTSLLKLVFFTDGYYSLSGFHLKVEAACGSHFSGDSGVLRSSDIVPYLTQQAHIHNYVCDWSISVKTRRTIQITFDQFNIPPDGVCSSSYIMLLNGGRSSSPLLGRGKYCGASTPVLPETSSNQVFIRLGINSFASGAPQFELRFRELALSCGGHLYIDETTRYVEIQSPNYPSPPQHEIECNWIIMSPSGTRLRIDFDSEFHMSANCYSDIGNNMEYVQLYDGGTEYAEPLRRFCGTEHPSSVMTTGNTLYVTYLTQVEHPQAGFKAKIQTAECGGMISSFYDLITTPNYPQNYSSSLECEWVLKMKMGYSLVLNLINLDTPPAYNCSLTDYLEIREFDSEGEVVGIFCGSMSNASSQVFDMASHQAYIKFKSDGSRTGMGFQLAFQGNFDDGCGGSFDVPSGVITSPKYPAPLLHPRECYWRITAPEGRIVTITFTEFNLPRDESTGICISSLQVYNVTFWRQRTREINLCGSEIPNQIDSSSTTVYIKLSSRGLSSGQGFSLSYTTDKEANCGGVLPMPSGSFVSPNFTFTNHSWADCMWKISAERDNHTVAFHFDILDIPGHVANYCRNGVLLFKPVAGNSYNRFCGNMTSSRPSLTSPYKETSIILYANLEKPFTGFRATYNFSECGGVIEGHDAIITSPGYPNNYSTSLDCHWIIKVPYGEQIKLTTIDMKLEDNCEKDYVLVRNGVHLYSPILGKFCGTQLPALVTSDYNQLSIIFHSNQYGTAPGFKMTTEEVERGCGGLIHTKRGTIMSPHYPNRYDSNVECVWTIELTPGYMVNLTFVDRFDIEMDNVCSNDYLLIEDYDDGRWRELGKKCGQEKPQSIISSSTKMRITFHSNAQIQGDGFQIKHSEVCGGHFTDHAGVIFSPNYPDIYDDNLDCKYLIGRPDSYLKLKFDPKKFSVEEAENCIYDHVIVYEGNSTSAPSRGKFCGGNPPPGSLVILGQVLVEFKTDYGYRGHGFLAEYKTTDCGGNLTQSQGLFHSPTYPHDYLNSMDCMWVIHGEENRALSLSFLFLDLEASYGCNFDYLEIFEGNSSGKSIGKLCGNQQPPLIKSTSQQLLVHFHTDSSVVKSGFAAVYYNSFGALQGCGGTIVAPSGEISSLDFDKDGNYEPFLICSWSLIGTDEQVIQITFSEFNVESSPNETCRYDFVEVRDGLYSQDPLIGRYCGTRIPGPITASSNMVTVLFRTDDKENRPGFKAQFTSVPTPCGPSMLVATNVSQTLMSPNYPLSYPPNLWCRWHFLLTEANTYFGRVQISFTDVDIPCGENYIEVHADNHVSKPYRFCGSTHPHDVIAQHGLWMSFHTDNTQTGKGFSLTYKIAECNRTYSRDNGVIFSPNFPSTYSNQQKCIMLIETTPGRTISIYFSRFELYNYEDNCNYVSLKVYDGDSTSSPLMTTICGMTIPNPVFSTGHQLLLDLTNPHVHTYFIISYTTTDKGRGCGGSLTHENGTFSSPMYPEAYNKSTDCQWQLSVPGHHSMTLEFDFFALNSTSGCDTNFIEIFEGSEDTPSKRVSRLCGDDAPGAYNSRGSQLLVKLVTDTTNTAPGFLAHFHMNALYEEETVFVLQELPHMGDTIDLSPDY